MKMLWFFGCGARNDARANLKKTRGQFWYAAQRRQDFFYAKYAAAKSAKNPTMPLKSLTRAKKADLLVKSKPQIF